MWLATHFLVWIAAVALSLHGTESAVAGKQNVALNKPVRGAIKAGAALVDGKLETSINPEARGIPMVYIDLQGVYKLSEINLYAQKQANSGLNQKFTLYAWDKYTSPCDMEGLYPWKTVKAGLSFKSKGEKITVQVPVNAHYLIISPDITDPNAKNPGLALAEVEAFGEKIKDTYQYKVPEPGTPIPNVWNETRHAILRNQRWLLAQISYFSYVPDPEFKDVTLGYYYDNNNTMAAIRGKARMILMSGPRVLRRLLNDPLYDAMRENVRKWLNPQNPNAKFVNVSQQFKDGDILTITRFDTFDHNAIAKRLKEGKNSAVITYLAARNENDNNKVAKLLKAMNVKYRYVNMAFGQVNQNATEILENGDRDVPWDYQLKVALSSFKQFNERIMHYYIPRRLVVTPEIQKLVRQVIEKYYDLFTYLAPCPSHTYKKDNDTWIAQINYAKVLMLQRGENIIVAPGAFGAPGSVKFTAKQVNLTAEYKRDFGDFFAPTGLYVQAGKPIRYKILERSERYVFAYKGQINPQTDLIDKRDVLHRWPLITYQIDLDEEGILVSPFGGPLVLHIPQNGSLKIRLEGGYRYPFFNIRDPQAKSKWEEEKRLYKGIPYGLIFGDAMTSMLPEEVLQRMDPETIFWSTNHFDNVVKFMHNYRGTKFEEDWRQTYVSDVELTAGFGHSGHPWMSYVSGANVFADIETIKKGTSILFPHEIGHNLQVWAMTFKNGLQVTTNVYIPAINYYLLKHKDAYEIGKGMWMGKGDLDAMVKDWKNGSYNGVEVNFYTYLSHYLGPGLITNTWIHAAGQRASGDPETFWLKTVCEESGYDLIPFHLLWRFPIKEQAKRACSKFQCWLPDDQWTKQVPDHVNKILKDYGKQCIRKNTKPKIQAKANLERGLSKIRPQTIFLKHD